MAEGLVAGMKWNKVGNKICIVYEDGAVILGHVDGNRLWGKEVKNTNLDHVQWSPNDKLLLFATSKGCLQIFDESGMFVTNVEDYCHGAAEVRIASMDWYSGAIDRGTPCLAIAYNDGWLQISQDNRDTTPVKVKMDLKPLKILWNTNGAFLAISGYQEEKCTIQFRNNTGQVLNGAQVVSQVFASSWSKYWFDILVLRWVEISSRYRYFSFYH